MCSGIPCSVEGIILQDIRKLDMDSKVNNGKELEEMILVNQYKTDIVVRRNSLVNVSYVDRHPVVARNFVNTLVNEYVERKHFCKERRSL